MGTLDTIINRYVWVIIFIMVFIILLMCICKFCKYTNDIQVTNINTHNLSDTQLEINYLESQIRVVEEYLDITNTLRTYLDNLQEKKPINNDNIVIVVGPTADNIQLGTKITD